MEILKFEKDFVERTKHILLNYRGPYEISNVLNCMLGLLVLPYENLSPSNDPLWDEDIAHIPAIKLARIAKFQPIREIKAGTTHYYPTTLRYFLKKLRNGVAHQHISPITTTVYLLACKFGINSLARMELKTLTFSLIHRKLSSDLPSSLLMNI